MDTPVRADKIVAYYRMLGYDFEEKTLIEDGETYVVREFNLVVREAGFARIDRSNLTPRTGRLTVYYNKDGLVHRSGRKPALFGNGRKEIWENGVRMDL